LIRYLDYPAGADAPPIFNDVRGGLVRPDWLAISHCPESAMSPETFVVYFLTSEGEVIECIQRDTLEIAMDEALSLTGLAHDVWAVCGVPLDEGTSLRRSIIANDAEEGRTK
jgi:hypothetical protein